MSEKKGIWLKLKQTWVNMLLSCAENEKLSQFRVQKDKQMSVKLDNPIKVSKM
jgi:hypothetical protein